MMHNNRKNKPHHRHPLKTAPPREDNSFSSVVSLTCACNRDLTLAELGKTYPAQSKNRLEQFIEHLNNTFRKYLISSCLEKAHFLAQVGHETGQLHFTAEQLGSGIKEKDVYDGYKGRGLIQITYKAGYLAYGDYVDRDFTGEKKVDLEEVSWATDSAGWFWSIRNSPSLVKSSDKNDLIEITIKINGGLNGYNDRVTQLNRAAKALLIDQCQNRQACPNTSAYYLTTSAANESSDAAFAWGLWHDPSSKQKGTSKDVTEAIAGYQRFLDIKQQQKHGRFGFKKPQNMIEHAEKRIKELEKG